MRHLLRHIVIGCTAFLIVESALLHDASAALPARNLKLDTAQIDAQRELIRNSLPDIKQAFPIKKDPRRLGVEVTAESALVVDAKTGRILFGKNIHSERPLASITKLMTALVLLDLKLDPSEPITLLESDRQPLGRYYLAPGDVVGRRELFRLSLGASANNATSALVRTSGLSADGFSERMNQKAKELGIKAKFLDPIGLNPGNVSNTLGVQKLLRAAMQHDEIREATTLKSVTLTKNKTERFTTDSTNDLLVTFLARSPYAIVGGKTGFIEEAGYCLAQTVRYGGHDVDVVVLGATEHLLRFEEVKALAVWTFDAYTWE